MRLFCFGQWQLGGDVLCFLSDRDGLRSCGVCLGLGEILLLFQLARAEISDLNKAVSRKFSV